MTLGLIEDDPPPIMGDDTSMTSIITVIMVMVKIRVCDRAEPCHTGGKSQDRVLCALLLPSTFIAPYCGKPSRMDLPVTTRFWTCLFKVTR